jgi:hypothetical protein
MRKSGAEGLTDLGRFSVVAVDPELPSHPVTQVKVGLHGIVMTWAEEKRFIWFDPICVWFVAVRQGVHGASGALRRAAHDQDHCGFRQGGSQREAEMHA